ncbi:MAG: aminoacyl-tRNA hydrolase [Solirubrobacterales bacterium]|nr:aminoacyl-tRNA hydrolase [Solirubrobacterales bacterium]MCB0859195.1 aminoacyl-tRNA hydrolase [Solirubrobacterales bacterium]
MRRSDPEDGSDGPILIVGLGNPGREYERSRHNAGFMVAALLAERWDMPRAKEKYNARITEGRIRPGGPRVVLMTPLTYMNESGKSAGPARGSKKIPLEKVIAVYDEIDLPFGEIRSRLGGGAAGHNGVKSLKQGFGSADFWRVRIGVDRPDSTDPDRVAGYVLGKFSESREQVEGLIDDAARETERLVERIAAGETGEN